MKRLPDTELEVMKALWSSGPDTPRSALEEALRAWEIPIVGRVSRNQYLLDVRTLTDADWAEIIRALDTILN